MFASTAQFSFTAVNRHRNDWLGPRAVPTPPGACRVDVRRHELAGHPVDELIPVDCNASNAHPLFVIGDSHALGYRTVLIEYARRTGVPATLYSAPCGFPRNLLPRSDCRAIDDAVIADVRQRAKPGDVIFLASLRVPRFRNQWDARDSDTASAWRVAEQRFDPVVGEATAMLQAIAGRGVRIVFELPKPIFKIPLFRCSDWFNRINPACESGSELDRAFLQSYRQPVLAFADALRTRVDGFSTWDPFPLLCPREVCSMWRDGRPLFFDGDHVTYFANMLLADDFIATIRDVSRKIPPPANNSNADPLMLRSR